MTANAVRHNQYLDHAVYTSVLLAGIKTPVWWTHTHLQKRRLK